MDRKRMIEDYEVVHAVRLAGCKVILAENLKSSEPYLICEAHRNNPFGIEEYTNAAVSADYLELMQEFTARLTLLVGTLETERAELGIPQQTLTDMDCDPGGIGTDWKGRVVVIKAESLAPEYRSIEHQLALCTGGFGANPSSQGRAVYCIELYTGHENRWNREDITGTLAPERLPEWARDKLDAILEPTAKDSIRDRLKQGGAAVEQQATTPKSRSKSNPEL